MQHETLQTFDSSQFKSAGENAIKSINMKYNMKHKHLYEN